MRFRDMPASGTALAAHFVYAYMLGNSHSGLRLVRSICNLRGWAARSEFPWRIRRTPGI